MYISQYKIRDFFFLVFRCDASFVGGDRVQVRKESQWGQNLYEIESEFFSLPQFHEKSILATEILGICVNVL